MTLWMTSGEHSTGVVCPTWSSLISKWLLILRIMIFFRTSSQCYSSNFVLPLGSVSVLLVERERFSTRPLHCRVPCTALQQFTCWQGIKCISALPWCFPNAWRSIIQTLTYPQGKMQNQNQSKNTSPVL